MSDRKAVDRYAVFGNPIAHSKSPQIHTLFAEQTGQQLTYEKVCVAEDAFEAEVRQFFAKGGKGLNITVPFKLRAWQIADTLTDRARKAEAVNTLYMDCGQLLGDNTDGAGMVGDITANLGWPIAGQRILVLGAGGAVRGILAPLLAEQPQQVFIVNRSAEKAARLAELFAGDGQIYGGGFGDLVGQKFDLIINGTSASLQGELPPLPDDLLAINGSCYDMMYAAEPTVFLRWAQQRGCQQMADGLGMLVGQAAEAFYLWRDVRPAVAPVIAHLR